MTIRLHRGDLPDLSRYRSGAVAIDTETMGLEHRRDRLCVVQLSPGDGSADVVQIPHNAPGAPNLQKLLADPAILKIFHFARFDVVVVDDYLRPELEAVNAISQTLSTQLDLTALLPQVGGKVFETFGVMPTPVYCTKIASRLARTYTDKHGLKDLVRELLGVELSKQLQLSDWGAADLTEAQVAYAASDVLHLHALKAKLDTMLAREGREELAAACLRFLPDRVRLDRAGWALEDIFAHS